MANHGPVVYLGQNHGLTVWLMAGHLYYTQSGLAVGLAGYVGLMRGVRDFHVLFQGEYNAYFYYDYNVSTFSNVVKELGNRNVFTYISYTF